MPPHAGSVRSKRRKTGRETGAHRDSILGTRSRRQITTSRRIFATSVSSRRDLAAKETRERESAVVVGRFRATREKHVASPAGIARPRKRIEFRIPCTLALSSDAIGGKVKSRSWVAGEPAKPVSIIRREALTRKLSFLPFVAHIICIYMISLRN